MGSYPHNENTLWQLSVINSLRCASDGRMSLNPLGIRVCNKISPCVIKVASSCLAPRSHCYVRIYIVLYGLNRLDVHSLYHSTVVECKRRESL